MSVEKSGLNQHKQEAEAETAEAAPSKAKYEKDDFFDELSCEALERLAIAEGGGGGRMDGRSRAATQRKVHKPDIVWGRE